MAHAVPLYASQLFRLLDNLGWPQKRCADVLGFTIQRVNDWASGRASVPLRHRRALFTLIETVLTETFAVAETAPATLAACRERCNQGVLQWYYECQERLGNMDRWHEELQKRLAVHFKTQLSQQGLEAWQAELRLHLDAANTLRRLIRLHDPTSTPTQLETTYAQFEDPIWWLRSVATSFGYGESLPEEPMRAQSES